MATDDGNINRPLVDAENPAIASPSSVLVTYNGVQGTLQITQTGDLCFTPARISVPRGLFGWLLRRFKPKAEIEVIPGERILGATASSGSSGAGFAFSVSHYVDATSKLGSIQRNHFRIKTTPRFTLADAAAGHELVKALQRRSWWGRAAPPGIVIILNPVSGRGKSRRALQESVLPLLRDAAGLRVRVLETNARMHAAELLAGLELQGGEGAGGTGAVPPVDLVLYVGGDGTLHEGLQGLFRRPDWASACRLPFGSIPTGSGNGLAASCGLFDMHTALVAVCRGHTQPVDVASALQPPGSRRYCVLSFVYGLMANLDIGTEHLRWMGEIRFTLGGVWEIIRGRGYACRVFVKRAGDVADDAAAATDMQPMASPVAPSTRSPEASAAAGGPNAAGKGMAAPLLPNSSSTGADAVHIQIPGAAAGDSDGSLLEHYPAGPPLPLLASLGRLPQAPLPDSPSAMPGWTMIEPLQLAKFGCYGPQYLALGTRMNPEGRLCKGAWDVVWVGRHERPATRRLQGLRVVLTVEDGSYVDLDYVHSMPVRAMVFEPRDRATWTVLDGEAAPDAPVYLEVHRGLCNVLVSPAFTEPQHAPPQVLG